MSNSEKIRIQKYLSQKGICSRRQAEDFIKRGYVFVNGDCVKELGAKVHPRFDDVQLNKDARSVIESFEYIAFHKPKGIVTHSPQDGDLAIKDVLPHKYKHLAPVGRLDKDSCGLILLTNDGMFAKRCLQHQDPHKRVYDIKVSKPLSDDDISELEEGVLLFSEFTKPCTIERLHEYRYRVTLFEGKNRQIRRMIQKVGSMVVHLKRIQFGNFELRHIEAGQCLEIKPDQVL